MSILCASVVMRTEFFESPHGIFSLLFSLAFHTRRVFFKGRCRVSGERVFLIARMWQVQLYIFWIWIARWRVWLRRWSFSRWLCFLNFWRRLFCERLGWDLWKGLSLGILGTARWNWMRAGRRGRSHRIVLGESSMTLVMCSHFSIRESWGRSFLWSGWNSRTTDGISTHTLTCLCWALMKFFNETFTTLVRCARSST